MTTGWIVVNILVSAAVSAVVAGASIFVPLHLSREQGQDVVLTGHSALAVDAAVDVARQTAAAV